LILIAVFLIHKIIIFLAWLLIYALLVILLTLVLLVATSDPWITISCIWRWSLNFWLRLLFSLFSSHWAFVWLLLYCTSYTCPYSSCWLISWIRWWLLSFF